MAEPADLKMAEGRRRLRAWLLGMEPGAIGRGYSARAAVRVASASVRKAENIENVGGRQRDVLPLRGSQRPWVTEPLLPQLLSGVIPDLG